MPVAVDDFRDAHARLGKRAELLVDAAQVLPGISRAEREALLADVVSFLRDEIEPHTRLDERVLYPEVADRMGDPLATASMSYDHLAIREWIADLAAADVTDTERLQKLLYGLYALIRVHIWKEERLYLPLFESSSWPAQ
jgi:iron-sulfur cluster repair protein YtfE (RIC family)